MNIKELSSWRKTCFHCGEELSIHPSMAGIYTRFYVKNNFFYSENSFLGFGVHLETGKLVVSDPIGVDLPKLLTSQALEIKFKCDFCEPEVCYYDYSAKYRANPEQTHMICSSMGETLYHRDKYYIFQYKDINQASISSWSKVAAEAPLGPKPKEIANVWVPYINLFNLTPDKLEQKIKTYVLFS